MDNVLTLVIIETKCVLGALGLNDAETEQLPEVTSQ